MRFPPVPPHSDSTPVRIVIAAVQSSFRTFLRRQVESDSHLHVVGAASDADAALALVRRLKPDIVLIECAVNRELSTRRTSTPLNTGIVVIVETPRIQDIMEAIELGARGVVLRASLPPVWRTGLRSVIAGQYWVEDRSVAVLLDAVRSLLGRPQPAKEVLPDLGLTLREMEIAGEIAAGRSNKDVSRQFSICERTVKHHLTNIFRKVGVTSRLELAVLMRDRIPAAQERGSSEKPQLYLVEP